MFDEIIDKSTSKVLDVQWKKNGEFPYTAPNPYYRAKATEKDGHARYVHGSFQIDDYNGNPSHFHAKCADARSNSRKLIRNKALEKLDGELTVVNSLFESWYERREAYALLTSALKGLVTFTRNWKKPAYWSSLKTGVKRPTALPEAWLAYGFGIQPLIGLVNDTMEGLAKPLDSHTFKGAASGEYTSSFAYDKANITGLCKHMTIFGCEVRPKENPNYALMNATGLNQPFSSAWSVAPWGWAVDYFVNVSQLLSNIEVRHPNVDFINYWETVNYETFWEGHRRRGMFDGTWVMHYQGSGYSTERLVLPSYPKYNVTLDFPILGSNQAAYLSSALAITLKGNKK